MACPGSVISRALSAGGLGLWIWWPDDPIAVPWIPVVLTVMAVATGLVAIVGTVIGWGMPQPGRNFRVGIGVLIGIGIVCSTVIATNGSLVNQKIRYNWPIAEQRAEALYQAAMLATQESGQEASAEDAAKVRKFYRGPRFSDGEWEGRTRNFMRENGFVYQIHIAPSPGQGVLVYALPIEYQDRVGPGSCLDDTRRMQCPLNVMRGQRCVPCSAEKN